MNIVQFGSNKGNDHVQSFVANNINNIDKVVLVDANIDCVKKSKEVYEQLNIPNLEVYHYAIITGNETSIDLYIPSDEEFCPQSSVIKDYLLGYNIDVNTVRSITVPAINVNTFFEEKKLQTIDRLYIDIEGLDVPVINTIDFTKVDIKHLCFEKKHAGYAFSDGNVPIYFECLKMLKKLGYEISETDWDTTAIKN